MSVNIAGPVMANPQSFFMIGGRFSRLNEQLKYWSIAWGSLLNRLRPMLLRQKGPLKPFLPGSPANFPIVSLARRRRHRKCAGSRKSRDDVRCLREIVHSGHCRRIYAGMGHYEG